MTRSELLVYGALCLIWSTTWLAIRVGVRYLPPFGFAGLRFLLATLILGALLLARSPRSGYSALPWKSLVLTGLLQFGVSYGIVFWAEQEITAGFASISFACIPLFVAILAQLMLHEHLDSRKLAGIGLGIAGMVFLFSGRVGGMGERVLPRVAMLVAAMASAIANVLVQRDQRHISMRIAITVQMIIGTICLLGMSLVVDRGREYTWNLSAIVSLLFLSVFGSAIAFMLYYWLLHRATAVKATTIGLVAPVLTVIQGHFFLDESLGWNHLVGGAMILIGSALVVMSPAARKA
ncbi:MAG: EamA family transporter [Acidobacteria bacterium]|nr:EamA family transporter [Acidobacteriota bacterium]